jgi:hypothetical protein
MVGTPRCGVPARVAAGGTDRPIAYFTAHIAPLSGADSANGLPLPIFIQFDASPE